MVSDGWNGNKGVFKEGNGLLKRRYCQRNLFFAPKVAFRCWKLTGMPVGGMDLFSDVASALFQRLLHSAGDFNG
ncbi:hypothetical protein [Akkermansia sp.]|uniref:hypothetical protein n=1 Tax=Akkermansia sp. TaxID=1872421 RepID=UPI0025B94D76|nr:hypothetical protein [Akkermansia sp.]